MPEAIDWRVAQVSLLRPGFKDCDRMPRARPTSMPTIRAIRSKGYLFIKQRSFSAIGMLSPDLPRKGLARDSTDEDAQGEQGKG